MRRPVLAYRGPFAHQTNAETRRFEYPWAYQQINACGRHLNIVEIGGGLAGMQFVLASEGHAVTNVDPGGADASEWGFRPERHAYLARLFKGAATLIARPLEEADLPDKSADVVVCLSVLEHLDPDSLAKCLGAVRRIIKPQGVAVLTVDLFLDLVPFSSTPTGRWGRNVDVREVLELAGLELVRGDKRELFGFPEFDSDAILRNKAKYLVSRAGSVAQCLVAKPRAAGTIR
jgi:SAM-dependent methyltransferase